MPEEMLGAVLAGGRGRRMGRDKALLRVGGRSLVERAVAVLGAELADVVVARGVLELPGAGAPVVADRLPGQGPLGGVHAALERARGRPAFILACDLPRVNRELVRWLIDAAGDGARSGARVWYAGLGGERQPLCGVWSPGCREAIERALAAGQRGVRKLVGRLEATVCEPPSHLPWVRADLLHNLNRPRDLAAIGAAPEAGLP